jgi:hypothetical protein
MPESLRRAWKNCEKIKISHRKAARNAKDRVFIFAVDPLKIPAHRKDNKLKDNSATKNEELNNITEQITIIRPERLLYFTFGPLSGK